MADLKKIQFLRTKIKGKQPTTDQVAEGELAINLVDRSLFTNDGNKIISLGFAKGGDVDGNINQVGDFKTTGIIETSKGGAAVKLTSPSHSYIEFYGDSNNTRFAYLGKSAQSEVGITLSKDGGASLSLYKTNARLTKPLSVADQITVTTDETTDILGSHKITLIDKGVQTGQLTLPKEKGTLATLNHVASRIVDSLDSTDATKILSANMGSVIDTRLKEQDPRQWGFGSHIEIASGEKPGTVYAKRSAVYLDNFVGDTLTNSYNMKFAHSSINYYGIISFQHSGNAIRIRSVTPGGNIDRDLYHTLNTSIDPNGFLRASGSKITLTTSNLVQTTGVATQNVMSQKAVTEALDKKLDKSSVKGGVGTSTADVMSQKAVTDELNKKVNLTGGELTGSLKFNHANNTIYDSEHISFAPQGSKNYLRKMRGGKDDTIWHETVEGNNYRLSIGATDSKEIFKLYQNTGAYVLGNKVVTEDRIVEDVGDSDTNVMSQKAITKALKDSASVDTLYPVGIVVFFAQNKDPNKLFPKTTWAYIGENKTIRLANEDGTNLLATGGYDAISITKSHLPNETISFTGATNSTGDHAHSRGTMEITGQVQGQALWDANSAKASGAFVVDPSYKNRSTSLGGGSFPQRLKIKASGGWTGETSIAGAHAHTVSGRTEALGQGTKINVTNAFVMLMGWYRVS